jgi:hypothetical protein
MEPSSVRIEIRDRILEALWTNEEECAYASGIFKGERIKIRNTAAGISCTLLE